MRKLGGPQRPKSNAASAVRGPDRRIDMPRSGH
jgi:hypothetical protein